MERMTRKTTPTASSKFLLLPTIPPMLPVMGEQICEAHRKAVKTYEDYARRLCEYEDTGLTPAEITTMQAENKRLQEENKGLALRELDRKKRFDEMESSYADKLEWHSDEQVIKDFRDIATEYSGGLKCWFTAPFVKKLNRAIIHLQSDLAAYKQAEAEGRLVKVPKLRSIVYLKHDGMMQGDEPLKMTADSITIGPDGVTVWGKVMTSNLQVIRGGWMRTIFPTEESARAALHQ